MLLTGTLMRMNSLYEEIRRSVRGNVRQNEPMLKHTSFGIGGPADIWVEPESLHDLLALLSICTESNIPYMVIGRGSNLLVRDRGIRGVVINLNRVCGGLHETQKGIAAGAGVSLIALVKFALRHGLGGLEFCVGIPGSVGGALAGNAGAWGSSIGDYVDTVLVYDAVQQEKRELKKSDIGFGYRKSNLASVGIILEAAFSLETGNPSEISARMEQYISQRAKRQPLRAKSAGSVFKNPAGQFAGAIIEQLGFKGRRSGGAAVSDIHANFIVNLGEATSADVLSLIDQVKMRAKEELGVDLEQEIEVVGEE